MAAAHARRGCVCMFLWNSIASGAPLPIAHCRNPAIRRPWHKQRRQSTRCIARGRIDGTRGTTCRSATLRPWCLAGCVRVGDRAGSSCPPCLLPQVSVAVALYSNATVGETTVECVVTPPAMTPSVIRSLHGKSKANSVAKYFCRAVASPPLSCQAVRGPYLLSSRPCCDFCKMGLSRICFQQTMFAPPEQNTTECRDSARECPMAARAGCAPRTKLTDTNGHWVC